MNWYTSDLHLGHRAIIEMQNRPFTDVDEMNRTLISNFNSRVQKNDKVYVLGDCTHHKTSEEAHQLLKKLNGRKYLIVGNHDKYIDKGDVFEDVDKMMEVHDCGKVFVMCHYPLFSWHGMRKGNIMLHGHIHSAPSYNLRNKEQNILRYDVGVDANNFFPVNSKEILTFFGEYILNNPKVEFTG